MALIVGLTRQPTRSGPVGHGFRKLGAPNSRWQPIRRSDRRRKVGDCLTHRATQSTCLPVNGRQKSMGASTRSAAPSGSLFSLVSFCTDRANSICDRRQAVGSSPSAQSSYNVTQWLLGVNEFFVDQLGKSASLTPKRRDTGIAVNDAPDNRCHLGPCLAGSGVTRRSHR